MLLWAILLSITLDLDRYFFLFCFVFSDLLFVQDHNTCRNKTELMVVNFPCPEANEWNRSISHSKMWECLKVEIAILLVKWLNGCYWFKNVKYEKRDFWQVPAIKMNRVEAILVSLVPKILFKLWYLWVCEILNNFVKKMTYCQ